MGCTPKIGKYTVEDPVQCDKYYVCETDGTLVPKLCEDGLVYDIPGKSCNHPQREKCNEYTTCVDGNPTPGKCSTGVVWSPSILACTRPDQSKRPECEAAVVHEFICPNTRLRFGNHVRLPQPTDC